MRTMAAVLEELGEPLRVVELEIPPLQPGQVLVEVAYSGVCHTQWLEWRGSRGPDPYLPHCLGHEGSGTVLEVGEGVRKCRSGDRVVLSWIQGSGKNVGGTTYSWTRHGATRTVNAGGVTTFADHTVVSENRVTPIPADASMMDAALIGCAVATGMGTVFNVADVRPGESVAVLGVGGVGLCAIAAAKVLGANPIIAVDKVPARLQVAAEMGASHTIDPSSTDLDEALRGICPNGVRRCIESSGHPQLMQQALESVRPRDGVAVVIGNAASGSSVSIDPHHFNLGKRLLGTWGGETQPDRDFPRYWNIMRSAACHLRPLFGQMYPLDRVNEALNDLAAGHVARPLLALSAASDDSARS